MKTKPNYDPKTSDKLEKIFGVCPLWNSKKGAWEIQLYGQEFNAQHLFQACNALECSPEELFWNPDLDFSGCYYEGDTPQQIIVLKVCRQHG